MSLLSRMVEAILYTIASCLVLGLRGGSGCLAKEVHVSACMHGGRPTDEVLRVPVACDVVTLFFM